MLSIKNLLTAVENNLYSLCMYDNNFKQFLTCLCVIVYSVYRIQYCTLYSVQWRGSRILYYLQCAEMIKGNAGLRMRSFALLLLSLYGSELLLSIFLKEPKSDSLFFNPNQSGIPADSKGVACWYFNTNFPRTHHWYSTKREKRLTFRARLRYLEN